MEYNDIVKNTCEGESIKINNKYFCTEKYIERIAIPIDVLLIEANKRAKDINKFAYIRVVGLGLGHGKYVNNKTKYL